MGLFCRSVRNIVLLVFVLCLVCLALFVSPRLGAHAVGKTAPTLKVQPRNIGIPGDGINCSNYLATGTICHVTVSETKNSSKGLHWYATPASGSDATFQPAS